MPSIDSLMFARSSVFAREDRVMSETLSLFLGADVSDNQGVWTFVGLSPRQRLDGAARSECTRVNRKIHRTPALSFLAESLCTKKPR